MSGITMGEVEYSQLMHQLDKLRAVITDISVENANLKQENQDLRERLMLRKHITEEEQ